MSRPWSVEPAGAPNLQLVSTSRRLEAARVRTRTPLVSGAAVNDRKSYPRPRGRSLVET